MVIHRHACNMAEGVEFTLTSLSEKNDEGCWFLPAQNYDALTRKHDLLERSGAGAIAPSYQGGWRLVDELPVTDELSGIPMSDDTVASRWKRSHELVLKHLMNKARGNWLRCRVGG